MSVVVQRVAAGVGVLGLLAVLPFYLASGLVAPLWAIIVLWVVWLGLGLLSLRWFRSQPVGGAPASRRRAGGLVGRSHPGRAGPRLDRVRAAQRNGLA